MKYFCIALLFAVFFIAPLVNAAVLPIELERGERGLEGSGNVGTVTFWSGKRKVAGDSNLFWDNVAKRLGLGQDKPQAKLHIKADKEQTGVQVEINNQAASVGGPTYGLKSVIWSGGADQYGGYFAVNTDGGVGKSYGLYAKSNPEGYQESIGVYGQGRHYGVHAFNSDDGSGTGSALLAEQQSSGSGYALTAKGKSRFTRSLEIGGAGGVSGITLYDRETAEPYCLFLASGILTSEAGKCE